MNNIIKLITEIGFYPSSVNNVFRDSLLYYFHTKNKYRILIDTSRDYTVFSFTKNNTDSVYYTDTVEFILFIKEEFKILLRQKKIKKLINDGNR